MNKQTQKIDNRWLIYDADKLPEPQLSYFNIKALEANGVVTGYAAGRGQTCFFKAENTVWALRHYYRGGLIAKLIKDRYFGLRLKNTRAWKEWQLLAEMRRLGLPVPVPIAASIIKQGIFYQADLITEYLADTEDLAGLISKKILKQTLWQKLGEVIAQFHNNGVYHSDLNAKNILINSAHEIYLIDFDQCGFRKGNAWKQATLNRLKRSLDKFKNANNDFNFSESDWGIFNQAYQSSVSN